MHRTFNYVYMQVSESALDACCIRYKRITVSTVLLDAKSHGESPAICWQAGAASCQPIADHSSRDFRPPQEFNFNLQPFAPPLDNVLNKLHVH